ncbi:MAG: AAA family ATPase [Bacteroidales bacterium]|jgi:AAA15 family ATPase/GTPase|nr:AAA family ATPase [Bacteroidales bacterium]
MIVNFAIQNFRSIKDRVHLSFEATKSDDLEEYYVNRVGSEKNIRLLKLGLIYGANASGKTTVLEALDFLRDIVIDPFEKKTEQFKYKTFLFDSNTVNENTLFSIEFVQNGIKYLYDVELNKSAIINEKMYFYNPNKALVFERVTDESKQLAKIQFGSKIKINKEYKSILEANTLWNNSVLGGYLKTNFESKELKETTDWFENKLKPLIKPQTDLFTYVSERLENEEIDKKNVISLLKKADFNISDIIIKKGSKEISSELIEVISKSVSIPDEVISEMKQTKTVSGREIQFQHTFKDNKPYFLPYMSESAGTQRYYQFSGLIDLMIRSESIFTIDELESSLHPDLFKHFLLTFLVNSNNSQLIASTHHRELLMEKDIFRNDVIWFTEKNEDGSSDLFSLVDFDSSVVRNTSSVYNAYKIGKLGAAPNLNDYYIEYEKKS